jgi:hypothetical protein
MKISISLKIYHKINVLGAMGADFVPISQANFEQILKRPWADFGIWSIFWED